MKGKLYYNLTLINNEFTNPREGIEFVVKLLKESNNLKEFYWVSNEIVSLEDANYLVRSIIDHPSINRIRLENCFGWHVNYGYEMLRSILTSDKSSSLLTLIESTFRPMVEQKYQTLL